MIGWTVLRVAIVWLPRPSEAALKTVAGAKDILARDFPLVAPAQAEELGGRPPLSRIARPLMVRKAFSPTVARPVRPLLDSRSVVIAASMISAPEAEEPAGRPQLVSPVPGATPMPGRAARNRWSASAWLLLREGDRTLPGLASGQLGGSQAGLRIAYGLGTSGRVALVGRVVGPVSGKGREAALGIEWRPTRLPVRLVAEQRFSLDGGRGGPVIGLVGGTGPARIAAGLDLESYGQAGIIRRGRTEAFADGAARLTHRMTTRGRTSIDLGLGIWGGAQRDARRLDIGPTLGARLPVGTKAIRVAIDWRQRVAGDARPNSGPALTIGSDF